VWGQHPHPVKKHNSVTESEKMTNNNTEPAVDMSQTAQPTWGLRVGPTQVEQKWRRD